MIHIDFIEPDSAEWVEWRRMCDAEQEKHNAAVEAGKKPSVKSRVYKGQRNEVYMSLDGPFHGKCAYCEQKIFGDQRGDIEHFRPKNAVKDETNSRVTRVIDGRVEEHPGYYWLAYCWKNLLPSCLLCNQLATDKSSGRSTGKGNKFPVKVFRAWRKGDEDQEEPLLLHPAFDHPGEHLEVDEYGILQPRTERGKMCVDIFGLNDRGLPDDRRRKYEDVKQKVQLLARAAAHNADSAETKDLLVQLIHIKKGYGEFTLSARKAIVDAKSCVEATLGKL